jgi:ATP-dependent helicase/nuclease subunit B
MPIAESAVDAPATVPAVATPTPSAAPAPAAPPARAPKRISVSGYETLIACPYRYFAETQLGLRPSEEVSEALEKSDFGELVHAILARFHREVPEVSAAGEAAAIERLVALSNAEFARALRRNFIDRAWLARWLSSVPAYVAWQVGREADGWRVSAVEADRFLAIDTPGGRTITLVGRLDRIDSLRDDRRDSRRDDRSSGATEATLAVIDYKAQGADELKKRAAQPGEHVQLPAYALLVGEAAGETLFLSIARDEISPCAAGGHPGPAARANRDRLARLADRLHEGAPMPANGIEKVCEYCAVSGLCRRDFWVDAQRPDAVSEPRPGDDE